MFFGFYLTFWAYICTCS